MNIKRFNKNNSNNNSNNNSLSISHFKKTDEELSKDIFIHILRINFFNFLKNIKESNRHKLLLINCYFFLVKHKSVDDTTDYSTDGKAREKWTGRLYKIATDVDKCTDDSGDTGTQ